ncbi:hypothetical protein Agub_g9148 [Astrephomene gubernaculifera]|uniref:Serine/threonine-protein phosphatase n=1 Tax=Astrephomene gubernaculifera TaxID=47775 RepID=A0AAD3DT32_9CHLO|nr:hypothetical protein Agub_g9148 [Astrephomene gubernaculifera]
MDLMRMWGWCGSPDGSIPWVFLGDYVDRTAYSCEVVLVLYALKIKWPEKIVMLRGNHEIATINEYYGFKEELIRKWGRGNGQTLFEAFNDSFDYLPLAAVAVPPGYECDPELAYDDDTQSQFDPSSRSPSPRRRLLNDRFIPSRYLMVHGGIGRLERLSEISNVQRPVRSGDCDVAELTMLELVWSDPAPSDECNGLLLNKRDNYSGGIVSYGADRVLQFCKRNRITAILRGHECIQEGLELAFGGRVVTFFSAVNYGGQGSNHGCILHLGLTADDGDMPSIEIEPIRIEAKLRAPLPNTYADDDGDVTDTEPDQVSSGGCHQADRPGQDPKQNQQGQPDESGRGAGRGVDQSQSGHGAAQESQSGFAEPTRAAGLPAQDQGPHPVHDSMPNSVSGGGEADHVDNTVSASELPAPTLEDGDGPAMAAPVPHPQHEYENPPADPEEDVAAVPEAPAASDEPTPDGIALQSLLLHYAWPVLLSTAQSHLEALGNAGGKPGTEDVASVVAVEVQPAGHSDDGLTAWKPFDMECPFGSPSADIDDDGNEINPTGGQAVSFPMNASSAGDVRASKTPELTRRHSAVVQLADYSSEDVDSESPGDLKAVATPALVGLSLLAGYASEDESQVALQAAAVGSAFGSPVGLDDDDDISTETDSLLDNGSDSVSPGKRTHSKEEGRAPSTARVAGDGAGLQSPVKRQVVELQDADGPWRHPAENAMGVFHWAALAARDDSRCPTPPRPSRGASVF